MNYKAAPAWSFKGKSKPSINKDKTAVPTASPSPSSYQPQVSSTLSKAPSWKYNIT